ncbi:MAG: YebC/PmpR family DNA-binding transcriptional regulator [Holosporaceae bacterium]|jgi:YebC/PmpR family DNA-binding regulatory protein|nr:YebC/PmpR family DNA-binding transcriptional regulator [Holosporaceae bacterium]
MSGHSQFKNIMYRKGAQDARKAKVFSKISREITVAVKEGGTDPESNTRLRSALISARSENMPKDNVDRAVKKAMGGEAGVDYTSVRYEGYGPGGVAIIVEGLTDNKNRTASDVRSSFSKFGGSLGETNSVSFQFDRVGYISYPVKITSEDGMFEAAIDAGADDMTAGDEVFEIICKMDKLSEVRDKLIKKFGDPQEAKVTWMPKNTVPINKDTAQSLFKLIEQLEDSDDVQSVTANCDIVTA